MCCYCHLLSGLPLHITHMVLACIFMVLLTSILLMILYFMFLMIFSAIVRKIRFMCLSLFCLCKFIPSAPWQMEQCYSGDDDDICMLVG